MALRRYFALGLLALLSTIVVACGTSPTSTQQTEEAVTTLFNPLIPIFTDSSLISEGLTDASPPLHAPDRPAGSPGFSRYTFMEVGGEVVAILVEGPLGEQVRSPISYLELKQLYASGEAPPEELRMSREELGELVRQLDTVREATEKYRDVEVALADGYVEVDREVPNMGAHFPHPQRLTDGVFNPAEPEFLLYIRDDTGNWELVGTGFVLPTPQFGHDHPEGFVGPLDNWHVHYNLCLTSRATRRATRDECDAQGGDWFASLGWMIHTYVWVDSPLGVFSMWNPNIPPVVPASILREPRTDATPQEGEVALTIENFSHREAQLKAGETVVWTNVDGVPHTVTFGSQGVAEDGFNSGYIVPGQSFALKFDQPGEYRYTCTLHPSMNGDITVY